MLKEVSYDEILKLKNYVLIDLRTPAEYSESTIPTAINLPILTNEERIIIGKTYKNISVDEAKVLAMQFVGPRLHLVYRQLKELAYGKIMVMFCARGGLRSKVLAYTMASMGLPIFRLDSGYKGYRNYVLNHTPEILEDLNFVTLFGKTGTGKTDILNHLQTLGADVLDLEKCANHRGSLMGAIGIKKVNSQKQFENNVFDSLVKRKSNLIFTEGESKRIGNIILSNQLYEKTRSGNNVFIETPLNIRIDNIRKDYIVGEDIDNQIIEALSKLEKYISKKNIELFKNKVLEKNYDFVIERLMLDYYDLNYKSVNKDFKFNYCNNDSLETAKKLMEEFC